MQFTRINEKGRQRKEEARLSRRIRYMPDEAYSCPSSAVTLVLEDANFFVLQKFTYINEYLRSMVTTTDDTTK
ncbi:unnamed protein product [Amoebophrya sp. A25]|nr:unnamed protein product [Amoebophrya sp. A25]|eukprot:GSA25T00025014001.1